MHVRVLLLAFVTASTCSPWNILPFIYLANSYSSINTLLKYLLLPEVLLTPPSASPPLVEQILLIAVLFGFLSIHSH